MRVHNHHNKTRCVGFAMSAAHRLLTAVLGLVLVAGTSVACGGDDEDDTRDPTATTASNSTLAANDTPDDEQDDDSDDGDDDDAGDTDDGEAPVFEPGTWTGGEIEVTVTTSAKERTITGTLLDQSGTDGLTTRLIYAKGIDTVNISISREYEAFAMSTYFEADGFDAGSSFENPCQVTYTEVSETSIAGTFRCENGDIGSFPHLDEGAATLEGSFTATR